jgi:hypothetical protein
MWLTATEAVMSRKRTHNVISSSPIAASDQYQLLAFLNAFAEHGVPYTSRM